MGGVVPAIERGYIQHEIEASAYRVGQSIESGERVVVGVNAFRSDDPPVTVMKVDPAHEERQVARLKAFRARRDGAAAKAALDEVRRAAKGKDNLMPPILAAVKAEATLGEISDAMREVFGEYRETVVL